ncbi:MAG: hypothetical protein V2A71_04745, partial [Candidatus Eisenbacteria bacterium]
PEITGNTIRSNTTLGGGAVTAYYSTIVISSNRFELNEAFINGGGIVVDHCAVQIEGNILAHNYSHSIGGGIFLFACTGMVSGNTVVDNRAGSSSGIGCLGGVAPGIHKNIVVGNVGEIAGGIGCDEITSPDFYCNDVWGNVPDNYGPWCEDPTGTDGNFSDDPLFCDRTGGDHSLCADSPCLPGNHPAGYACGTIGALGIGCGVCGPTPVEFSTWGRVKSMFR